MITSQAHPKARPFRTKTLENFDLLQVLCEKHVATGEFARTIGEINSQDCNLQDCNSLSSDNDDEGRFHGEDCNDLINRALLLRWRGRT
jgi:hypothetical protein